MSIPINKIANRGQYNVTVDVLRRMREAKQNTLNMWRMTI